MIPAMIGDFVPFRQCSLDDFRVCLGIFTDEKESDVNVPFFEQYFLGGADSLPRESRL